MANNTMNDENKKKALDAAIAKLEESFGKEAVMSMVSGRSMCML